MKTPITLHLTEQPRAGPQASPGSPGAEAYNIPFAQPELIHADSHAVISRQSVRGSIYYMELYHYDIRHPQNIVTKIHLPQVIFCYGLQGQISSHGFSTLQNNNLAAGQYGSYYLPEGQCTLQLQKGIHAFFYFSLECHYLEWAAGQYPAIRNLAACLSGKSSTPLHLPLCPINFHIRKTIKRMQTCPRSDTALDIALLTYLLDLIAVYHHQLQTGEYQYSQTTKTSTQEVKDYIDQHYTNPSTSHIPSLADKFQISERTLAREFKNIYGTSIRHYIINLRMNHALKLLAENYSVRETSEAVGYQDPYSFSRAFKKHFGFTPNKAKSQANPGKR